LISAFFWDGNERKILNDCRAGKYEMVISPFILEEVDLVLRKKFILEERIVRAYIRELFEISHLVFLKGNLKVIKNDPSDDLIIETALNGNADAIISGDHDLLKLKEFNKIKINRAADLVR
jgi:putative PIN family toxin of toxin-antitoxin system